MKLLKNDIKSKSKQFDKLKENSINNIEEFLDKIENGLDGCFNLKIVTDDFEGKEITNLKNQYKINKIDNLKNLFETLKSIKKEYSFKEISRDFKAIFGVEIDKNLFRKGKPNVSTYEKSQIIYRPIDFVRSFIRKIELKKINFKNFNLNKLEPLDQFELQKFIKVFPINSSNEEKALKNFIKKVKILMESDVDKKQKEQSIFELSNKVSDLLIKTDVSASLLKIEMPFYYKKDSFELTSQKNDSLESNNYYAVKLEFYLSKKEDFKLLSYKEFKNQFKEVLKDKLEESYKEILLDSMKEHSIVSLNGKKSLLLCNRDALKRELKLELKRLIPLTKEEKILVAEIITEILEE